MSRLLTGYRGRALVGAALAFQLAILWWSLTGLLAMSIFCSVARAPLLLIFNAFHYGYAALLLLGVASLFWARARLPYVSLLGVTMLALPVQVWLVWNDVLYCDAP